MHDIGTWDGLTDAQYTVSSRQFIAKWLWPKMLNLQCLHQGKQLLQKYFWKSKFENTVWGQSYYLVSANWLQQPYLENWIFFDILKSIAKLDTLPIFKLKLLLMYGCQIFPKDFHRGLIFVPKYIKL